MQHIILTRDWLGGAVEECEKLRTIDPASVPAGLLRAAHEAINEAIDTIDYLFTALEDSEGENVALKERLDEALAEITYLNGELEACTGQEAVEA